MTDGTDNAACDVVTPCKWVGDYQYGYVSDEKTAQDMIEAAGPSDVVYLYFDRGDTWEFDSAAVTAVVDYGLWVDSDDPVVHINAYGEGNKPVWDGLVVDFTGADAPTHSITPGPRKWNAPVRIYQKNGCSVRNIHFKNLYGRAIYLGAAQDAIYSNSFTLEYCTIENIGSGAFHAGDGGTQNTYIRYNTIHTGMQLSKNQKDGNGGGGWPAVIIVTGDQGKDNIISYNVVYDIFGEFMDCQGYTAEYNLIGDTASGAFHPKSCGEVCQDTTFRYNLVMQSTSTEYDNIPFGGGSACHGVLGYDNQATDTPTDCTVEVYGNTFINRGLGISFAGDSGAKTETGGWTGIYVYNNLIVDSRPVAGNDYLCMQTPTFDHTAAGVGYIYNNVCVQYDSDVPYATGQYGGVGNLSDYYTISNNLFYDSDPDSDGTWAVGADWQTNYLTTDPLLPGEHTSDDAPIDWSVATGAGYYDDFKYTKHLYPTTGPSIQAGVDHAFEQTFLTTGTDFTDVLDGASAFVTTEQHTNLPDIGPWAREEATYSFYFSDDATGNAAGTDTAVDITHCQGPAGTAGGTCKTLAHAQAMVGFADPADTVTLYFDRTDTWTYDTAQVNTTTFALEIASTDPVVIIDAYGEGAKPVFDGLVADFDSGDAPTHNAVTGPERWNSFFKIRRSNCSIKNIEITQVYGHGIRSIGDGSNTLSVEYCDINKFGTSAVSMDGPASGNIIKHNTFHTGQQLMRFGKSGGSWTAAIQAQDQTSAYSGNQAMYNVIYDIYGEGINLLNGLSEYNVVGDTWSTAIGSSVFQQAWGEQIVRYNLIIHSSSATYYSGNSVGLRIYDEQLTGDNSAADIQVYGNTVINKAYGIRCFTTGDGGQIASVKVYNNLFIDNRVHNMAISNAAEFDAGYIYNNASILYDRTGVTHVSDSGVMTTWTIQNNAFWTAGSSIDCTDSGDIDADWATGCVDGDPILPGEALGVDWDGQDTATYFSDIKYTTHLYPIAGALIQAGFDHAFEQTFLTTGTDFTNVLSGDSAFETAEQHLEFPDIGPWARGTLEVAPTYPLQGVAGDFKYN